ARFGAARCEPLGRYFRARRVQPEPTDTGRALRTYGWDTDTTEDVCMARSISARAWLVAAAGLGINLALGVLYSWSVIAKSLSKPVAEGGWAWGSGQASLPYAIAVGVFAISMVFAGRAQDRFG